MIAEDDDEVASGGEAERADAVGIEVPFGSVSTGDAHGLLRVFEIASVFGVMLLERDAVFDEDAVDADGVEPGADLGAFEIVGEDAVASAGEDNDGGAGVVVCGRGIEGQGGIADVGEVRERLPATRRSVGLGDVGLGGAGVRLGAPLGQSGRVLVGRRRRARSRESEEEKESHAAMVMPCRTRPRDKWDRLTGMKCWIRRAGKRCSSCHCSGGLFAGSEEGRGTSGLGSQRQRLEEQAGLCA